MALPVLRIVNARQHNLKGFTVELPRRRLVVLTGPSGSGKSSLAFDTLYAEGQRRYIESLSSYAKQFLDRMPKPLVDHLEGIAPAVAIEQKNPTVSSRSTVGTATEVYDFLRLLWARVGTPFCRKCGHPVAKDTPPQAAARTGQLGDVRVQVTFPVAEPARVTHEALVENLRALGFRRVIGDGREYHLDEIPAGSDLAAGEEVLVVVDRLRSGDTDRLTEAIALGFAEGEGTCVVLHEGGRLRFTEQLACSVCDTPAVAQTPLLFSFNSPRGACGGCNGFGAVLEYDESLVIPDSRRSLIEGAIDPWTKPRYESRRKLLLETARKLGADPTARWRSLKPNVRRELLYGKVGRYVGIFPFLKGLEEKRYKQYIRVFLRQYQLAKTCPACQGTRLNEHALSVKLAGKTIAEVAALPLDALSRWILDL